MSLLDEYEESVERLRGDFVTRFDSLSDFGATHQCILRSVGVVNEELMRGVDDYIKGRSAYRRNSEACQLRLETSRGLKEKARESLRVRLAQQQDRRQQVGAMVLMDFAGGIAAAREPEQRVLSGEMLASQLAAFSAVERKRKCLDSEARAYSALLARLQQVVNSRALEHPDVLMSSEVRLPLSDADLAAALEMQLLRRLQGQLRSSLMQAALLDKAALQLVPETTRRKRRSSAL